MSLEASVEARIHSHAFDEGNPLAERNTRRAMFLTAAMMVIEIAGGWYYNSMAVLADGWHMSSHALALGLAVFAYSCARHFAGDQRFAFGTWKIEILTSYTTRDGRPRVVSGILSTWPPPACWSSLRSAWRSTWYQCGC